MNCRNMLLLGCLHKSGLIVKSQIVCVRQLYVLRYRPSTLFRDTLTRDTVRSQFMATKVKKKRRPVPRSQKQEKEAMKGGMLRKFFIVTLPMILVGTVVIIIVVLAIGMMQSVKENSKNFYKGTHLGLYRLALDKCKKNSMVTDVLGEPVSEVKSEGSQDKVKVTRKLEEKVQYYNMEFTIKGSRIHGTVSLEASKKPDEDFQIVFIVVDADNDKIIIEDNR